jgi:hypothetical protein
MFKKIYDGMTRGQMIRHIHMECDTSSGCYKLTDEELIALYKKIFDLVDL